MEASMPRTRKRVALRPNSTFATFHDIMQAQREASEAENSIIEKSETDGLGVVEDCNVVNPLTT